MVEDLETNKAGIVVIRNDQNDSSKGSKEEALTLKLEQEFDQLVTGLFRDTYGTYKILDVASNIDSNINKHVANKEHKEVMYVLIEPID